MSVSGKNSRAMNTTGTESISSAMEIPPPTAVETAAAPPPQTIFWTLLSRPVTPPASLIGLKMASRVLSMATSIFAFGREKEAFSWVLGGNF